MKVHVLGIDLAKREQLLKVIGELEPCLIGIEASTGAFIGSGNSRNSVML